MSATMIEASVRFKVCPFCRNHGKFVLRDGSKTNDSVSKTIAFEQIRTLLNKRRITTEEGGALQAAVRNCTLSDDLPAGQIRDLVDDLAKMPENAAAQCIALFKDYLPFAAA